MLVLIIAPKVSVRILRFSASPLEKTLFLNPNSNMNPKTTCLLIYSDSCIFKIIKIIYLTLPLVTIQTLPQDPNLPGPVSSHALPERCKIICSQHCNTYKHVKNNDKIKRCFGVGMISNFKLKMIRINCRK